MKRNSFFYQYLLFVSALLSIFPMAAKSQGSMEDYRQAEQFLHFNTLKLVRNLHLNPNWHNGGLWWMDELPGGMFRFQNYDFKQKSISEAFDHKALAHRLGEALNKQIKPDSLPFRYFKFLENGRQIVFETGGKIWTFDTRNKKLTSKESPERKWNTSYSPDSLWMLSLEDYNLFLTNTKTSHKQQLTFDGSHYYDYANPMSWYQTYELGKEEAYRPYIQVEWAPDSKRFLTYRLDRRKMEKLYMYQALPDSGMKAKVWYYYRPLAGEDTPKTLEYYVFEVESGKKTAVDVEPFADFLLNISPTWFANSQKLYMSRFKRGYKELDFFIVDAKTGKSEILLHESSNTMVEYQMSFGKMTKDNKYLAWASERDGYSHIYLYDVEAGKLMGQVTKGDFVVRSIEHIDGKSKTIWFTSGGREKGRDPYLRHFYKVGFNGKGLQLLTPEDAEHSISVSEDGKYFVDNYSRVDLPTISLLRDMQTGRELGRLSEADISELLKIGYRFPEPFVAKARDGITDIYGAFFYPVNFDPQKKYPIIDGIYTGPHHVRTPKSFARGLRNSDHALAQLGFVVVNIDGLGTAMRSKAFHDYSYANLADIGGPDRIGAMKQLAESRPWMDIEKVGIYGHSAGGYDAVRALIAHPDFYTVAVASAGSHDHHMSKAWWDEQYMGMPDSHYVAQSNISNAHLIKGHLLLITGDLDQNVNPANTLKLAARLVQLNREFELVLIPNAEHNLFDCPYTTRKRWDFFVRHLLGLNPPYEYKITVNS